MTTWEERITRRPDPVPRQRILSCGIFETDVACEVRVGYGEELLYSKLVIAVDAGREKAEQLRQAVLAKGGFTELSPVERPQ